MDIIEAKKYANYNGLAMGRRADKILAAIQKNDGYCPCYAMRTEATKCPCDFHMDDIQEVGRCHCGLFVRRDDA